MLLMLQIVLVCRKKATTYGLRWVIISITKKLFTYHKTIFLNLTIGSVSL